MIVLTVSIFLLSAACTATVARLLMVPARREVGDRGKNTQETAAIDRRAL